MQDSRPHLIRFGTYEVDPSAGELRKSGRLIKLQDQPFRLLVILLDNHGKVVSRDELRQRLWGKTHVDFEEGLNTAIRKLREALGDSAASPRFIETLPRRGYRFIAPAAMNADEPPAPEPPAAPRRAPVGRVLGALSALLAVAIPLGWFSLHRERPALTPSPPVQLTRDSGLSTDPAISRDGKF